MKTREKNPVIKNIGVTNTSIEQFMHLYNYSYIKRTIHTSMQLLINIDAINWNNLYINKLIYIETD